MSGFQTVKFYQWTQLIGRGEQLIDIHLRHRRITFQAPGQRTYKCRLRTVYQGPLGEVLYCTFSTGQLVDPNRYDPIGRDYGYIAGGEWIHRRDIQDYFHPLGAIKLSLGGASRFIQWDASTWLFLRRHANLSAAYDGCQHGPPLIYQFAWKRPKKEIVRRYWAFRQRISAPLDVTQAFTDFYHFCMLLYGVWSMKSMNTQSFPTRFLIVNQFR
ncbi:MAG: hypothetical protein ACE5OZ_17155 [Candidatus Heimdallarchaeota archaeon]